MDKQEQIRNTWECGLFISHILRIISNSVESIQRWDYSSPVQSSPVTPGPSRSNPKNTNSQFKITNWPFYHQLVISTFSSLVKIFAAVFGNAQKKLNAKQKLDAAKK